MHKFIGLAVLLVACMPPTFERQELAQLPAAALLLEGLDGQEEARWPDACWWERFGDPQLNILVQQALQQNPTIAEQAERIKQAVAAVGVSQAANFPQVEVSPGLNLLKYARQGPFGAFISPAQNVTFFLSQLIFNTQWMMDIWGQVSSAVETAQAMVAQREAELALRRLLISASTAKSYISWQAAMQREELEQQMRDVAQSILALTENIKAAALGNQLDVVDASTQLNLAIQQVNEACLASKQLRYMLQELVAAGDGMLPKGITAKALTGELSETSLVPQDIPLELVGRRPDLIAARWHVESAARAVQVSRTAWYPNLNLLAGNFGLQTVSWERLLDPGAVELSIGPALSLPWFDGGARESQYSSSLSIYRAACQKYRESLLRATREVLEAVAALRQTQDNLQLAEKYYCDRLEQLQLVEARATSGLASQLNIETQRQQFYRAAIRLNHARELFLLSVVELQVSLGGGYETGTA